MGNKEWFGGFVPDSRIPKDGELAAVIRGRQNGINNSVTLRPT